MRIRLLIFLLLNFCAIAAVGFCSSPREIEIDLIDKYVKLNDLSLGKYKISGDFYFNIKKDDGSLTFTADIPGTYLLKFYSIEYFDKEVTLVAT